VQMGSGLIIDSAEKPCRHFPPSREKILSRLQF